jgi:hypothetical protein
MALVPSALGAAGASGTLTKGRTGGSGEGLAAWLGELLGLRGDSDLDSVLGVLDRQGTPEAHAAAVVLRERDLVNVHFEPPSPYLKGVQSGGDVVIYNNPRQVPVVAARTAVHEVTHWVQEKRGGVTDAIYQSNWRFYEEQAIRVTSRAFRDPPEVEEQLVREGLRAVEAYRARVGLAL